MGIEPIRRGVWIRIGKITLFSQNIEIIMKTCDECANYECDNFDGVGWCNLNKAMVLHDDPACKEFNELPDDGEKTE